MKIKKILLALVLIIVVVQIYRVTESSGMLVKLEPINLAQCDSITGVIGAEDITIDTYHNIAYIGADDRQKYLRDGQPIAENGAIWMLDLTQPNSSIVKFKTDMTGVFHPHGITLRKGERGEALELYVVNHIDSTHHEIDIFEIPERGVLKLRRRVSYPEMISPNDIVVVGKDQFFVTNDHGSTHHSLMQKAEDYLGLPMSSVTYFDGEKGHVVIEGLRMANGIALSSDMNTLYVAETMAHQVSRYVRGASIKQWEYKDSVALSFGVDNLEWSDQGRLLTAGHPKIFDFLAHVNDRSNDAPSKVVSIDVSGETMVAETLYLNMGEEISGASVAVKNGNTLLIGPVLDTHLLRCQLN